MMPAFADSAGIQEARNWLHQVTQLHSAERKRRSFGLLWWRKKEVKMGELTAEVCSMQKSWCPQYPGLNVQELLTSMDVEEGRKEKLGAPSARDMLKVWLCDPKSFSFCTIFSLSFFLIHEFRSILWVFSLFLLLNRWKFLLGPPASCVLKQVSREAVHSERRLGMARSRHWACVGALFIYVSILEWQMILVDSWRGKDAFVPTSHFSICNSAIPTSHLCNLHKLGL